MTHELIERRDRAFPIATRLGVAAAVLVLEAALATLLGDAKPWVAHGGAGALLGRVGGVVQLGSAVAVALAITAGPRLRKDWHRLSREIPDAPVSVRTLCLHGGVYAGFVAVTHALFGRAPDEVPNAGLLFGLWLAAGVASAFSLLFAFVPVLRLRPLLRGLSGPLLAGLVVGALAWAAGQATELLWEPLSQVTLHGVRALLGVFSSQVVYEPAELLVGTPKFTVAVSSLCSGYEGVGLISVLLGVYLVHSRASLRFPRVLIILPAAISVIWLANIVRIVLLIGVGNSISPAVAEQGFHSKAGWVFFCATALLAIFVTQRSKYFARDEGAAHVASSQAPMENPTAPLLVPFLAVVAASLVGGLFAAGFDALYPLRVVAGVAALVVFRESYKSLGFRVRLVPVLLGVAVFIPWMFYAPVPDAETQAAWTAGYEALPAWAGVAWLLSRCVGTVVIAPVVEELAFRSFLIRRLIKRDFTAVSGAHFTWLSFLGSSILFGAIHQRMLAGMLAGMVYAFAVYRRGRVEDAIVAHGTTNALLAACALGGETWLWM